MKKLFLFSIAITLTFFFLLAGWNIYHSLQGEQTRVYNRFYTTDSTGTNFNWLGLLSPIQTETQQTINDTTYFSFQVPYPYGKNFECIEPDDTTAEQLVADEIAQRINDTLNKVFINTEFDYDGRSVAVRKSQNPLTKRLSKATVSLSLFGTASPEARKYGFQESILPGHIEEENQELATARLGRTTDKLIYNLRDVDSLNVVGFATELQFEDSASAEVALNDATILDGMRYVQVDATIFTQRLEVTPVTVPVLVPFWLWSLLFGLLYFWHLRLPKLQRPKFQWAPFSWGGPLYFLKILAYCVGASILMTALFAFIDWRWVFFFMMLALIGIFGYFVIKYREVIMQTIIDFIIWFAELLLSVVMFIWRLILLIWKVLLFIWDVLISVWKWLKKIYWYLRRRWAICWDALPPCWRKVFIALVIYAIFATYQWLACPC